MDQDHEITDELERLQSNISTLFRSVINNKNNYKQDKEKSDSSVQSLMTEVITLRNENEQLRRSNKSRISCENCSVLKEQLKIHDARSKELEKKLDFFRKMVCNVSYQDGNPHLSKLPWKIDEFKSKNQKIFTEISHRSNNLNDEIKNEFKKENIILNETFQENTEQGNSEEFHETIEQKQDNGEKKRNYDIRTIETICEESNLVNSSDNNSKARYEKMIIEFSTPKKGNKSVEMDFISSTFCSNSGSKKGETSPILVDPRFMINKSSFPGSPNYLKRKAGESSSISPGKFKNRTLFPKSPKQKKYKSPGKGSRIKSVSQLKNSNYIDVEISFSGVRKLKQTQLNPDYYISRTQDNGNLNKFNSNENSNDEDRFDEDDVILESPKYSGNFFVDLKKTFSEDESESERKRTSDDVENSKSAAGEVFDPEETFVSSSFIRNNIKELKIERESLFDERERSPEYNTVPNVYKGSPVRKKAERMRLPGQTCMECNEYYKAILGEIDPKKLQNILNQCSRHRDHHYNIADTPPGYWKPYLTASMDGSRVEDDETQFDE